MQCLHNRIETTTQALTNSSGDVLNLCVHLNVRARSWSACCVAISSRETRTHKRRLTKRRKIIPVVPCVLRDSGTSGRRLSLHSEWRSAGTVTAAAMRWSLYTQRASRTTRMPLAEACATDSKQQHTASLLLVQSKLFVCLLTRQSTRIKT